MEKKEKAKRYYLKNEDKIKEYQKRWRLENKNEIKIIAKRYRLENKENVKKYLLENKEKRKDSTKKWRLKNRDKIKKWTRDYVKERRKTDIMFKLRMNIRIRLRKAIKSKFGEKIFSVSGNTTYTNGELKKHLEKQFTQKMNWNNYGRYWAVDHVVPLSWCKTESQIIKYGTKLSNLQPLETKLNSEKHDSYAGNKNTGLNIIFL